MGSSLCEEVYLCIEDSRIVFDGIEYKDHFIVLDSNLGLWRPVVFEKTGKSMLRGVCSGLTLVPTRNEAFKRGKEIVNEITGSE